MKTIFVLGIFAFATMAAAMNYTARVEIRNSLQGNATSIAGGASGLVNNSFMNFGVGVTLDVFDFNQQWALIAGGMLRQREWGYSGNNITVTDTVTSLDIPLEGQYSFGSFAVRAGLLFGLKLSNAYGFSSGLTSTGLSENSLIIPFTVGFDWHVANNHLIYLDYETAAGLTAATAGTNGLTGGTASTGGSIDIGYGYTF